MEKYIEKLYEEFIKTQKIQITKKNKESSFERWLEEKKIILNYYGEFLETMDFIPRRGVMEFDKGIKDSVLTYIKKEYIGILLSEYTKNIKLDNKIVGINGNLTIENKSIFLEYDNKKRLLDFINFYITQLPIEDSTLNLLINLISNNKNVFIGAYGNLNDADYDNKLKKLYDLKKEIEIYTGKNIDGEVTMTSNYYLACITPKLKYKKKN